LGEAKNTFEELRSADFISDYGNRGIELDNSNFDSLIDVLHYDCEWSKMELKTKLKHYEGWGNHDFSE